MKSPRMSEVLFPFRGVSPKDRYFGCEASLMGTMVDIPRIYREKELLLSILLQWTLGDMTVDQPLKINVPLLQISIA